MAYKVIILYRLYMPSYVLGTFTEYPFIFLSKGCISGGNQPFSLLFLWGWVYSLVFAFFYVV